MCKLGLHVNTNSDNKYYVGEFNGRLNTHAIMMHVTHAHTHTRRRRDVNIGIASITNTFSVLPKY